MYVVMILFYFCQQIVDLISGLHKHLNSLYFFPCFQFLILFIFAGFMGALASPLLFASHDRHLNVIVHLTLVQQHI